MFLAALGGILVSTAAFSAQPVPKLWGRCGDQLYMELRHPAMPLRNCIRRPRTEAKGDCLIPHWDNQRDCKKPFAQETPAFKRCKVKRTFGELPLKEGSGIVK